MFKAAVVRLTLWYLLIIMILSIGFSIALYRVSVRELDANQLELEDLIERSFFIGRQPPNFQEFNQARLKQIILSRTTIKTNLVYFNLIILMAGGAASYLLARRTLQPIEESVDAQARFTSDASHELRTPLTAMKSEIEVALRDKNLTLVESKELHLSTLEEIDRLESLSSGLLKLAQQDTRDSENSFLPHSVEEIIQEAVKRMQPAAKKKEINFGLEVGQQVIKGDRWSLVELISILLDNAIKYSPESSTISLNSFSKPHSHEVGISISDTGPGIAASDLPRIFDRFYRADRSRTQGLTPGYGLGLSIAKKIADLHRASIEAKSVLDKGSTFTLLFPATSNKKDL